MLFRSRLAPDLPRDGLCEPEPIFEEFCANNSLAHPVTEPSKHAWGVVLAKRHAVAALAGIAEEEILAESVGRAPVAEDSEHDRENAIADLHLAFRYIWMIGQPDVPEPDVEHYFEQSKRLAKKILSWPSSRNAVEALADVLITRIDIADPIEIMNLIEQHLRFGAAFSPFCAGTEF